VGWPGRASWLTGSALITGGDQRDRRGGRRLYAREGADIVIVCLPDEVEDAGNVKAMVEAGGAGAAS